MIVVGLLVTDSDEDDADIHVPAVDWPGESGLYLNVNLSSVSMENSPIYRDECSLNGIRDSMFIF